MRLEVLPRSTSLLLLYSLSKRCLCGDPPIARSPQPIPYGQSPTNGNQHPSTNGLILNPYQSNNTSNLSSSGLDPQDHEIRPVYLAMHVRLAGEQVFPPTYEKLFPVYASLHFNGTSTDAPMEVQLIESGQNVIRITDWGLHNNDKPLGISQPGYLTEFFELFGQTNISNRQILDPSSGKGLIHDVWSQNTSLALKSWNSIDFMHACIAQLKLGLASSDDMTATIPTRIALAQTYWRNLWVAEKVITRYPVWYEALNGWGTQVKKTRAEFHWEVGADPSAGMVRSHPVSVDQASTNQSYENDMSSLAAPEMTETYLASDNITQSAPELQFIYAQPQHSQHISKRAPPTAELVLQPGADGYNMGRQLQVVDGVYQADARPATDLIRPGNAVTDATEARIGLRSIASIARLIGDVGAVVGTITFIVLDLKNAQPGNHQELIFGLVSMVTAIESAFMMTIMGAVVLGEFTMIASVILAAVPSMIASVEHDHAPHSWSQRSSVATLPSSTDVQGILQYTIVGDRNQTGNEKCLNKGYKECTTVYGPYFLAAALKIELFDAFALLIHYNKGFPMSMADLTKAFTLKSDPNSGNKAAIIDCSHSIHPHDRNSKDLWAHADYETSQQECNRPVFSINRPLVTVPILNETADVIYDRLMPKGNWSLIGDVVGGEKFAAYNITLRGGAVSIACGIAGAINMNGTASPLPSVPFSVTNTSSLTNQSMPLSLTNLGNQSSDGSSGRGYLAPPPPSHFQPALNLSNSICLGALPGGNTLYLPNGTYSRQDGSLGFDSTKANTLTLAANSSLTATVITISKTERIGPNAPLPPLQTAYHQYKTNQSVADVPFGQDMQNINQHDKYNTFTVNVPMQPDAACFYQQPYGRGNFACFGPGGGDLPPGLKNNIKSVKAYGRASVEIFANNYGNRFAHIVDTYESDLSQIPYDAQTTFGDVVAAIWVYIEPGSMIPTNTGS